MGNGTKKPKNNGAKTGASPKSGRVLNIVQYERNPVTGASLNFTEQNIRDCVAHKSIKRYAYIKHDKDHYSEVDCEEFFEKYGIRKTINDLKPIHWHIVLEVPNKIKVSVIAKWLGIPENQIEVPNDRGKTPIHARGAEKVFLECVGYLTHADIRQQALDKTVYDDSEVNANFDWRTEVDAAELIRKKYGKEISEKQWYRNEVLTNGLRPKDMARNLLMTTAYTEDFMMLDKLRKKYLRDFAPMPSTRFNYYIYSEEGRTGKGLISRAFARSLYPEIDDDDDLYFNVGGDKVSFDGYDGQPVIIWNDIRPYQLISIFGDRGNMLDSLDIHPVRKDEHIKFGKLCLTNTVNIFNGIMPYVEFFDGLAGEYTDRNGMKIRSELGQKEQVYGRFPMVIPISAEDFSIMINAGIMKKGAFTEYYEHRKVIAHFRKVHETLSAREEVVKKLDAKMVKPLVEVHGDIASYTTKRDDYENMTDDEILACFVNEGEVITYRDKTEAELQAGYQEYLYKAYVKHKSEFPQCADFEEWVKKGYWGVHAMDYNTWIGCVSKRVEGE